MNKYFHGLLLGVSVLPALAIMPAIAETVTERHVITENTSYSDLVAEDIASSTANNGGVFYMEDVQDVTLTFNGTTSFKNNSLSGPSSGMGGAIGNGWLSTKDTAVWDTYTPGGKIVFNGQTTFEGNTDTDSNGAGAVFNYGVGTIESPDILFNDTVTFKGNKAIGTSNSVYVGGGAIHNQNGAIVFKKSAVFMNNESGSKGGAVTNSGKMLFEDTAEFTGNTAATGGGIAIIGGEVAFEKTAVFTDNSANNGSAISMDGTDSKLTFKEFATFKNNVGTGTLRDNNATSKIYFEKGALFDGNTNTNNGSLEHKGLLSVTGGDFKFTNNTGTTGGGLDSAGTVAIDTTGEILFDSNKTSSSGAALSSSGTATMTANKIAFYRNVADGGYGGAVVNFADLSLLGANNIFVDNVTKNTSTEKSGGGAVHNRGNTGTTTLVIGTSGSTNLFDSNISYAHGGAIATRAVDGNKQNSEATINGTTTFVNNKAKANGGAVWNYVAEKSGTTGTSDFVFNGTTTFKNNIAEGFGGAVYNNDTMTFNGDTVFTGNSDSTGANDIHNLGIVTVASGTTTIDGGITGDGTLAIAQGATLNIGTASVEQGAIALDGTMLATLRDGDAQITAGTFDGNGTLKLSFAGEGTYHVFGNTAFRKAGIDVTSSMYDITWADNDKDLIVSVKSVEDIAEANGIEQDTAAAIVGLNTSTSEKLNDLGVLIQEKLAEATPEAKHEVEQATKAIHPEKESVTQSVATSVQTAVTNLASARMAAPTIGRNGGDLNLTSGGVWAQGLFNKSKQNNSFDGYTRGVAVGLDGTINKVWTVGAGYSYAHSDINGSARDTEIDSNTVFVYGQYKPAEWYMNAVANYTMSDYSEKGAALGTPVTADYDIDSFGVAIATGYDFASGVTPELGLRYMHVNSESYTNSLDVKNKFDSTDYMTAMLGTKYGFNIMANRNMMFRPELRCAVKYDLLSDKSSASVIMPGVNAYTINGDRLSRIGGEFGIGLGMKYNAMDLSINYDIDVRDDYTSQTGMLKFRYNF